MKDKASLFQSLCLNSSGFYLTQKKLTVRMQSINIPLFFCDIFSWLVYGKKQRLLLHGRTRDRQINTKERTKEKNMQ